VLNPMKELQKSGYELTLVPVDSTGLIKLDKLAQVLTEDTVLVSVMYANNEIGTIEPIRETSTIAHETGAYLHVDAAAAAGFVPIDVQADGIDLLTLSSNALYGLQGTGALYVKPGLRVQPILPGGGQERGLRSGTENVFGVAAMGEAARIAWEELDQHAQRYVQMRDGLVEEVLKIDKTYLTGHCTQRLPHHASFRFSGIEGESILLNMDMAHKIQVATGSACSSKTLEPSHVLLAIGLTHEAAHGSLVITLGRFNLPEDMPAVAGAVRQTVERLRMLSPLKSE
jgi:cysteine desulfurase